MKIWTITQKSGDGSFTAGIAVSKDEAAASAHEIISGYWLDWCGSRKMPDGWQDAQNILQAETTCNDEVFVDEFDISQHPDIPPDHKARMQIWANEIRKLADKYDAEAARYGLLAKSEDGDIRLDAAGKHYAAGKAFRDAISACPVTIPQHGGKDPDGMNAKRIGWGADAISSIMRSTGTEVENALSDLLANLMHWSRFTDQDFETELRRACNQFSQETREG